MSTTLASDSVEHHLANPGWDDASAVMNAKESERLSAVTKRPTPEPDHV